MSFNPRNLGISALAALVFLGAACSTSESCPEQMAQLADAGSQPDATDKGDASVPDPDPEAESLTLLPGETVTGLDGVTLGALEGALEESAEIRIEAASDLEEVTPLPNYVQAVGKPYEISASREINTPGDSFLLLGLPVPPGTATGNLAVAVLVPPGTVEDDGPGPEGPVWSIIRGKYDEQAKLFGTLVPYLGQPHGFLLVAGDDYIAEASEESDQQDRSVNRGFGVRCVGLDNTQCTEAHRVQTEEALVEIMEHYVGELGYQPPRLRIRTGLISFSPLQWLPSWYEYELQDRDQDTCDDRGGVYFRTTRQAMTCYRGAPETPQDRTTRHEFFHALQYAYPAFFENAGQRERVVLEGTARLAERSTTELLRNSGSQPRNITTALFRNVGNDQKADFHDYDAQDFFLYLGKRIDGHIDYLIPLFEQGGLRTDLDTLLRSGAPYPPNYSLGEAYWEWAKNVSFEKSISLGELDGFGTIPRGEPCAFYSRVATVDALSFSPSSGAQEPHSYDVAPLASRVIQVSFQPSSNPYGTTAQIDPSSAHLRVKFYDDVDRGTSDCIDRPEANSHTFNVDGWKTGYALLSNTGMTDTITVNLSFTEPEALPVPIARDDFVSNIGHGAIAIHVLANDESPSGSALSILDIGDPDNGSAILSAGQRITYTPDGGFNGEDTFPYTIRNEEGFESSAKVHVTVARNFRVILPAPLEGTVDRFHRVNLRGQTALDTILEDGRRRAQFMREDTSFLDLGTLGGLESSAQGLNDHGIVVGWSDTSGGLRRAFIWDEYLGMRDLGTLGSGGSSATAVNNQGWVVGASEVDGSGFRATLWHGVGQIVNLGAQLNGNSMAMGIDNRHPSPRIIGFHISDSMTHMPYPRAFLWVDTDGNGQAEASEFVMLGTLGGDASLAFGINLDGQIVGQSQNAAGIVNAFLWQNGTMTPLGTLGGSFSSARAINVHGQVVGEAERSDGSHRAFLWSEGVMVEATDDLMPPGWSLLSLEAINDSGQMAGTAQDASGNQRAVLLTPSH